MMGRELKLLRVKLGYSQFEMSIALGVCKASIVKMEVRAELLPIHSMAVRHFKYSVGIHPDTPAEEVQASSILLGVRRELVEWVKSRGVVGSLDVAERFGVTRSCAVKRLTDLSDRGFLVAHKSSDQTIHGHCVMYKAGSSLC